MLEPTRVRLPDGTVVWARVGEADRLGTDGPSNVGARQRMVFAVEGMTELIQGMAGSIAQAARAVGPDEAAVEFGVELSGGTGALLAMLANGEATASVRVTLIWRKAEQEDPDPAISGPAAAEAAE
jgi:hypothetical protein